MFAIELQDITKKYGSLTALDRVSLSVDNGELFGVIGPDGAGKTSLFRILTTLIKPTDGEASVLGLNPVDDYYDLRPLLGYMPGKFSLYSDLSVRENMDFFASVFDTTLKENYDLVAPIYSQLEQFKNRLAGALSGGMKQKLALSCALIHKPKLLVLDEPTTGVDAVSRQEFWEMLKQLQSPELTIIVSTPYMDEAEQCDRVALIDDGHILKVDTPEQVVKSFPKPLYAIKADHQYQLITTMRAYPHAETVQPFGEFIHYTDQRKNFDHHEIETYLAEQNLGDIIFREINPTIEDSFIRLMQNETSETEELE